MDKISGTKTEEGFFIGFDIGSVSLNTVVMDGNHNILENFYDYVHGKPFHVLKDRLSGLLEKYHRESIEGIAITGSGGSRNPAHRRSVRK